MPKKSRGGKATFLRLQKQEHREHFLRFIQGQESITVERKPSAEDLALVKAGIIPFGQLADITTITTANFVPVSMTVQAVKIFKLLSPSTKAIMNLELAETGVGGTLISGFEPAKAIVRVGPRDNARRYVNEQKKSGMTGIEYRQERTRSGSIPFGRSLSPDITETGSQPPTVPNAITKTDYAEVIQSLLTNAAMASNDGPFQLRGISFTPEVFKYTTSVSRFASTVTGDISEN